MSSISVVEVGDKPNQPRLQTFPKRSFGIKSINYRSFQAAWYGKWKWLHYDQSLDKAYCRTCIQAVKQGKVIQVPVKRHFLAQDTQTGKMPVGKSMVDLKHMSNHR